MLDIQALLAFLAVADSGSTYSAARTLELSQASVSRRLSRLEKSLGFPLFVRGGHCLRLNAAGARLLPEARAHINGLMQAIAEIRATGPEGKTTVTIGCLATLSLYVLPGILAEFLTDNPAVRVCVQDLPPQEIEDSVANGVADFALTMLGIGAPQLTHEVLTEEPLMLVCPSDHPLGRREHVTWSEIVNQPLIGIGPHSANQRLLDSASSSIGVHFDWQHEVQRITTAVGMVAAKIGLAVLPRSPDMDNRPEISLVPLVDPVVTRRIGILRRSGERLTPPAARLRQIITMRLKRRSSEGV